MKYPTPLELTAYHEAGHAVVATLLRRKIRHVAIRSEQALPPSWLGEEEQGRVRLAWVPVLCRLLHHVRDQTQTLNYLSIIQAGPAAEQLHCEHAGTHLGELAASAGPERISTVR